MCLPKSKLKGVLVVGKLVILVGSLVWVGILEITVGATALAVLRGRGSTTAGEWDGRLPTPRSYASSHHWNNGSNAAEEGTWLAFCKQLALHFPRRCQDKQWSSLATFLGTGWPLSFITWMIGAKFPWLISSWPKVRLQQPDHLDSDCSHSDAVGW